MTVDVDDRNAASAAGPASPRRSRLVRVLWIVTLAFFSAGGVLEWVVILAAPPFWWDDVPRGILTLLTFGLLKTTLLAVAAGLAAPTLARRLGAVGLAIAFGAVSVANDVAFGNVAWVYGDGVADLMVAPGFELAVGFSLAFLAFAVAYPVRGLGYLGLGAGLILILVGFLGSFALGGLPLIAAEVVAPVVAVAVALAVSHSRRVRSETAAESLAAAGAEYSRRTNVLAILALVFGVIGGSVLAVILVIPLYG